MWSGPPMSITEALKTYDVDEVKYSTELDAVFSSYVSAKPNSTIFTITSALSPLIRINTERLNSSLLKLSIEQARVIKDEYEIAMIRKANRISSLAHTAVLQKARAAENECELEAVFLERCVAQNAKKMAYPPIFASGKSAAVLHYEANDASTCGKLNMLVDAGAEWGNYASDTVSHRLMPSAPCMSAIVCQLEPGTDENVSFIWTLFQRVAGHLRDCVQDANGMYRYD